MTQPYAAAGIEPSLEELLSDPITLLLMQRDGIGVADVRRAVAAALSPLVSAPLATRELRGPGPALERPRDLGTDSPAG